MRIISLVPAHTEILFAIGLGDYLVGITAHCDFPKQALHKQWIGTFARPEITKIKLLRPDLVLADEVLHKACIEELGAAGINVFGFSPRTIRDLFGGVDELIEVTKRGDTSKAVVADWRRRVAAIEEKAAGRKRQRVIFIMGEHPLTTPGPASIQYDALRILGAEMIDADKDVSYSFISWDEIVSFNPEVVLACGRNEFEPPKAKCIGCEVENRPCDRSIGSIINRPELAGVAAVGSHKVHNIPCHWLCRPGPRLIDGLEKLFDILYE